METRDEYLEKMMTQERPKCPHCNREMSIWEVPPISFSDGLGWCAPYLFVCFNDDCSLYKQGWKHLEENFGQTASYRCMCYRDSDQFECMPVFSPQGATGLIIDNKAQLEEEMLKENIKRGFSILADCYVNKDGISVLRLLMDPAEPMRVRLKAAEMIGDIGEMEALDPLKALKIENELVQKQVDKSIQKLHDRYFTRDCPHCGMVIKQRAKICKGCGKEVAGV
jgi:hypothetical protein